MLKALSLLLGVCLFAAPVFAQDATPEMTPDATTQAGSGYTVNAPAEVDPTQSLTFLRFIHTSPDVGPVDIYAADTNTPLVTNLNYGDLTEEVIVQPSTGLVMRPAGAGAEEEGLIGLDFEFGGNTSWIVAVVGRVADANVLLEPLSVLRTDYNDLARVRVMNLISGSELVSVASDVTDVDFGGGLAFNDIADRDLPPGDYTLSFTGGDDMAIGEATTYTLGPNVTHTFLVVGSPDDLASASVFTVVSPRFETLVRFVNAGSEPIDIFIRPGDTAVVSGLEAGATSEDVVVPSGAVTFISYAPGTGPTGQELAAAAVQLDPARDVTITFSGDTAEITDLALATGLMQPPDAE